MQEIIDTYKAQLTEAISKSAKDETIFFTSLSSRPGEEYMLVEFVLQVMESFTKEMGFLVADYCGRTIEKYDDGKSAERIKKIRKKLPRTYHTKYALLIDTLNNKFKGICLCASKMNGNTSPRAEWYTVINYSKGDYEGHYTVECNMCKTRYPVREDTGYYYPTYSWSKI